MKFVINLEELSGSTREQLAKEISNKNLLDKLAEDTNEYVRAAVARNPKTTLSTLNKLAEDKYCIVRHAVAGNPNTS